MAEYQIVYWHNIPAMVIARQGRDKKRVHLTERFQRAIDQAAMEGGVVDTDSYLDGWRRGPWTPGDGSTDEIAHHVATELEKTYSSDYLRELARKTADSL